VRGKRTNRLSGRRRFPVSRNNRKPISRPSGAPPRRKTKIDLAPADPDTAHTILAKTARTRKTNLAPNPIKMKGRQLTQQPPAAASRRHR